MAKPSDLEGWQPLVRDPPDTRWRIIASRLAMLVLGLGLLFVAIYCTSLAYEVERDLMERGLGSGGGDTGGSDLMALIASICGLVGSLLTLGAVLPERLYDRFLRP